MGDLLSFKQPSSKSQFVLVLAQHELDWKLAAHLLESGESEYVASYYLIEHIDLLRSADMLCDYCSCILVGSETLSAADKKQLEMLAEELPVILLKRGSNIHDLSLEKKCAETIHPSELTKLNVANKLVHSQRAYECKKLAERSGLVLKYGDGHDIYQSAVDGADAFEADHIVSDVIDSLRLIARTKGVNLQWEPSESTQAVMLDRQETKRAIMGLLLDLFDYYGHIRLKISPSSMISDRCVWLDIDAMIQRGSGFDSDIETALSDSIMNLRKTLHLNQGQLFVLDQGPRSISFRVEWLAFS